MQHWPAADERVVSRIEEAYRNHFQAMRVDGRNVIFAHHLGLLVGAEHQRNIGTVDVSIEQADPVTHLAERERQVNGKRGLANSTFAGTNGDDGIDAGQGLRAGLLLAGIMGMSAHVFDYTGGRTRIGSSGDRAIGASEPKRFSITRWPDHPILLSSALLPPAPCRGTFDTRTRSIRAPAQRPSSTRPIQLAGHECRHRCFRW